MDLSEDILDYTYKENDHAYFSVDWEKLELFVHITRLRNSFLGVHSIFVGYVSQLSRETINQLLKDPVNIKPYKYLKELIFELIMKKGETEFLDAGKCWNDTKTAFDKFEAILDDDVKLLIEIVDV